MECSIGKETFTKEGEKLGEGEVNHEYFNIIYLLWEISNSEEVVTSQKKK